MTAFLFSPLDLRYAKDLPERLSEQASTQCQVEVEKAWLLTLMDHALCPKMSEKELDKAWAGLGFDEIEAFERRTQHATRALVEALGDRLEKAGRKDVAGWIHVGLTSFDCVDTAQRLRVKRFVTEDAFTQIKALKIELRRLANTHKDLVAVGRTHGQWAVPTLFGLQFAEAHERIDYLETRLARDVGELRGQSSGAIGGYHASTLLAGKPLEMEKEYLLRLGLTPHFGSTQILPPEDMLAVAQSFVSLCSVVAKLATDLRHLARSEIGEVAEGFAEGQVGSSTMPQKRNPWNLEHVCSLYKVLLSRLSLIESDLVSEHQRDLTNSASGRFHSEVFAVGFLMIKRLTKVLAKLDVINANVERNLNAAGSFVYAEAFYVLGAKQGVTDAHDVVREATRRAESQKITLLESMQSEDWFPKNMTLKKLQDEVLLGSRLKFAAISQNWKG